MISCVLLGLATKTCAVAPHVLTCIAARMLCILSHKVPEHDLALQSISKGS